MGIPYLFMYLPHGHTHTHTQKHTHTHRNTHTHIDAIQMDKRQGFEKEDCAWDSRLKLTEAGILHILSTSVLSLGNNRRDNDKKFNLVLLFNSSHF